MYRTNELEKIEKHTVDSLCRRNREFEALAAKNNITAYDGWDVGPVE
ncbi:MAG: hypothetical protein JXD23_04215 [Spirochaetales bacterium]|nr:hypothetical protein [Spirochaetales bacterium]